MTLPLPYCRFVNRAVLGARQPAAQPTQTTLLDRLLSTELQPPVTRGAPGAAIQTSASAQARAAGTQVVSQSMILFHVGHENVGHDRMVSLSIDALYNGFSLMHFWLLCMIVVCNAF